MLVVVDNIESLLTERGSGAMPGGGGDRAR